MPKRQEWTVRVVNWQDRNELPRLWSEQLRYLGSARELAEYDDRSVIEFYCPDKKEHDTKVWAQQNAARMRSFGIDAAAAPKWDSEQWTVDTSGADEITAARLKREYMERMNHRQK